MGDSLLIQDMEVPYGEAREYLLLGLANVIRQRGFETFVRAPIVLPEPQFFPDAVAAGPAGARTLLRRLLQYVGLGDYSVELYVFEEPPGLVGTSQLTLALERSEHMRAAAWYAGREGQVARFGVNRQELRHPTDLIGTLAHEVAHLYRDHHGLEVTDRETEENLTDLTTVYLGFGAFLLESSFSFRTGGESAEGHKLAWERQMRGYLTLGSLALLFGAQLVARQVPKNDVKHICSHLSPNQASLVRSTHSELARKTEPLRKLLGIPDPDTWREPSDLELLTEPLQTEDDEEFIFAGGEDGIEPTEPVLGDEVVLRDDGLEEEERLAREDEFGDEHGFGDEEEFEQRLDDDAQSFRPLKSRPSLLPAVLFGAVGLGCGAYFGTIPMLVLTVVGIAFGVFNAIRFRSYECSRCHIELAHDVGWCVGCDALVDWTTRAD